MTNSVARTATIEERDAFDAWVRRELRGQAEPVLHEPIPEDWVALLPAD